MSEEKYPIELLKHQCREKYEEGCNLAYQITCVLNNEPVDNAFMALSIAVADLISKLPPQCDKLNSKSFSILLETHLLLHKLFDEEQQRKGNNEMTIREKHTLAGKTVILNCRENNSVENLNGQKYRIEDWVVNINDGKSWKDCGNIACLKYLSRQIGLGLPDDDEVVYGKIGLYGHLIHVSELGEVVEGFNE